MSTNDPELERAIARLGSAPPLMPEFDDLASPVTAGEQSLVRSDLKRVPPISEKEYRTALADARASFDILRAPHATTTVILDRPAWSRLSQGNNSPMLVDVHIETGNSWVKLKHSSN